MKVQFKLYKQIGIYLGYPICCINSFIKRGYKLPTKNQINASILNNKRTGFIPCSNHAKQINKGNISITDLINNRKHPYQFPEQ
jgi:hypothetical protein